MSRRFAIFPTIDGAARQVKAAMEINRALVGQFRAGLAMLRECVDLCPDDRWGAVEQPPRSFWRIAYHAAFYTHLYLSQSYADFVAWDKHIDHATMTFADPGEELPPEGIFYSRNDLMEYIDFLSERMDAIFDSLDLETPESGFDWYPAFPKIDHVLLTLRHLGVHVGQLQELLFAKSADPEWISIR